MLREAATIGTHPVMETSVRIFEEHRLITLTLGGLFSVAEMSRMIDGLVADPDYCWTYDRLSFVKANSNLSEMAVPDLYTIKDKILGTVFDGVEVDPSQFPAYKNSVVCNSSTNNVLVKLFDSLWKLDETPVVDMRLFEALGPALDWLGRDPALAAIFDEELVGV